MNRRQYLSGLASLTVAPLAGCASEYVGGDDTQGPTLDAAEYLIDTDVVTTDWVFAPTDGADGYDFGFTNPNAILAMESRFRDVGATLQLAGSRHFLFWDSIDKEDLRQLTFIDRRNPEEGAYEAGAIVADGSFDRQAVLDEAPKLLDQAVSAERQQHGADLLRFESGDIVAVADDYLVLSVEPFRRDRVREPLVETILATGAGERETYIAANADLREVFSSFGEAHLYELGMGQRLREGPENALAIGESLKIEGAFADVRLVAIFETDADAEYATQFDPSFEQLAEEAIQTDTQVKGRKTITTLRVDTDVLDPQTDDGGGGMDPNPGIPGS